MKVPTHPLTGPWIDTNCRGGEDELPAEFTAGVWGLAVEGVGERQVLRTKHYSYRTEQCYLRWLLQCLRFHKRGQEWRHPATLGVAEVE
jgi:hypothetical protein